MANTNLTYSIPAVDCLGNAYPAIGEFKNKGGHAALVEVYTHLSSTVAGDYVFDAIADSTLKSRANSEANPSVNCMNPVVLAMPMGSGFSPTLDTSAIASTTAGLVEVDFDGITADSTTMKLNTPFPYGSLKLPV